MFFSEKSILPFYHLEIFPHQTPKGVFLRIVSLWKLFPDAQKPSSESSLKRNRFKRKVYWKLSKIRETYKGKDGIRPFFQLP